MDSGQKLMDTSDVEDAKNSRQYVLQVENENTTKNWTLVAHKNSTSSRTLSPTSQNNSPCSEKGVTGAGKILVMPQETYYDSLYENEQDNVLDICFDRVAREGHLSPRQQRSRSNKSKKKTHGRQHSWDSKMTEEFVPRHLPTRQAKHNHLTKLGTSLGLARSLDIV
ncbi:hypothetical protein H5410_026233 [Solanum commersonii]|uniref:Uncharacterized protein n=1 Tax=Solanum commersonii TaxID=4109 RepID=A0A9J5YY27_SOLCO|nr:hypothetical protein H5410_026233 [Solanum commersonii]